MQVACATDDRYAPHCAAMLHSLLTHSPSGRVGIHVLHGTGALTLQNRDRLRALAAPFGADLRLVEVPDGRARAFPDRRFHISCWYKILLPELLPELSRALYLDADMLILESLEPLWATDLAGHAFAAVINPLYPFMPDRAVRSLGLESAREYLNSGVLLMDLGRMRAGNLAERIRAYAAVHPDNPWPEQDALSVICRGQWLRLPPRWNAQTTLFDLAARDLPFPPDEAREARERPAIVHFIGPLKPWHYLSRHPLRRLYAKHRRATPWPEFQLEGRNWKNMLLRPFPLGTQIRLRKLFRKMRAAGAGLRT